MITVAGVENEEDELMRKGIAYVWNMEDGSRLHTLSGHRQPIHGISFSQQAEWMLTASMDGSISIWDSETGQEKSILYKEGNSVGSAFFLPSNDKVLSCENHGPPLIWDIAQQEVQYKMTFKGENHVGMIQKYAPELNLAAASFGNNVYLWEVEKGIVKLKIDHPGAVVDIAFHPTLPFIWTFTDRKVFKWWYDGDSIINKTLSQNPLPYFSAAQIGAFELENSLSYARLSVPDFRRNPNPLKMKAIWQYYYKRAKAANNGKEYTLYADKANELLKALNEGKD